MTNNLENLSQIFSNKIFRIPDYQRGYAWKQEQLIDFWEDLLNLEKGKNHYTGLLSLKRMTDLENLGNDKWILEKDYHAYYVVDGQQRLTTTVILVNEIINFIRNLKENVQKKTYEIYLNRDRLQDVISKYIYQMEIPGNIIQTYIFSYEKDNPSADYLKYKILEAKNEGIINETFYTKNLLYAKNFFANNLQLVYEQQGMGGINSIYDKLTRFFRFNIHEIDDDYDVFIAFETMNNRGKRLTNLELLKNRLIYLTTVYRDEVLSPNNKVALRAKINDSWKEVYFQLGRNRYESLSDDEFLRAHWIIFYKYSRYKGDDYINFLLERFSAKNILGNNLATVLDAKGKEIINTDGFESEERLSFKEIFDYVESIGHMAQYWYYTFFPEEHPYLNDEEKRWVDKINRIGIIYFRPLLAVLLSKNYTDSQKEERKKRLAAIKAIERYIFICFRLGDSRASFGSSEFYRSAMLLSKGDISIQNITDNLNQIVADNLDYSIKVFAMRIKEKFKSGAGYYDWNSLKYFLYEYEYSLLKNYGNKKLDWELFKKSSKDKISVEHILPQTPTNNYWQSRFGSLNEEELKYYVNALGNLLPLSQSVNSSLQNDSFDDKKNPSQNRRRGYIQGSHSEVEVAQEQEWTVKEILDRSEKLVMFMERRWNMKIIEPYRRQLVDMSLDTYIDNNQGAPDISKTVTSEKVEIKQQKTNYEMLVDYLKNSEKDKIEMTKEDLGEIIGQVPKSIFRWTAYSDKSNALGKYALSAKYNVKLVKEEQILIFSKINKGQY